MRAADVLGVITCSRREDLYLSRSNLALSAGSRPQYSSAAWFLNTSSCSSTIKSKAAAIASGSPFAWLRLWGSSFIKFNKFFSL